MILLRGFAVETIDAGRRQVIPRAVGGRRASHVLTLDAGLPLDAFTLAWLGRERIA